MFCCFRERIDKLLLGQLSTIQDIYESDYKCFVSYTDEINELKMIYFGSDAAPSLCTTLWSHLISHPQHYQIDYRLK